MPVPAFTLDGILPPFTGDPTDVATMSPFMVTVPEFVASFALTPEPVQILGACSSSAAASTASVSRAASSGSMAASSR